MTSADEPVRFTVDVHGSRIVGHAHGVGPSPKPGVVLCPGFSGTQDTPAVAAVVEAFVGAGLVAVTFDYRGFGQSGGEPRQVLSIPAQLADVRAVLEHVRSWAPIDPSRVALWGTSLGGGHVLTIAAEDAGLAAVVAQIPFNGFPRRVEGRSTRQALALVWTALRDRRRARSGRPPLYVPAVGSAEDRAVLVGTDATRTVEALTSATWENRVAPRGLLDMLRYRPGRRVGRIAAPLLVSVATRDRITPASTVARLADDAPRGTIHEYAVSHFDMYRPGIQEKVLRDQAGFLRQAARG